MRAASPVRCAGRDALYGYRLGSPRADLSFDRRDSAAYVPKGVVTAEQFDWGDDQRAAYRRGPRR